MSSREIVFLALVAILGAIAKGTLKLDNEVPYMLIGSKWMPICGHYFWDNNIGADIVCQNLGYSQGGVLEKERGPYSEDAYYVGRCDSRSITDLVNGCTKEILEAQYSCKKGRPVSIKVKCKGAELGTCLSSPGFPDSYPNNLHTHTYISLEVPAGQNIRVTFFQFDIEYGSSSCPYDYVKFLDASEEQVGAKLCGDSLPQPITIESSTAKVFFRTDGSVTKKGFKLCYSPGTYSKMDYSKFCSGSWARITSEATCRAAAAALNLKWGQSWDGPGDFPGCLHTKDKRNLVYFNSSPNPSNNPNLFPNYAEMCRTQAQAGTYKKMDYGKFCSGSWARITSEATCRAAAAALNLKWGNSWDGPGDFPGCLHTKDTTSNLVHFNTSPNPSNNPNVNANYAEMCQTQAQAGNYVAYHDGPGCGKQSITSSSECGNAASSLGFTGNVHDGNWGHAPPGCLVGHPKDGWKYTYFNTHGTGQIGRNVYQSICHNYE